MPIEHEAKILDVDPETTERLIVAAGARNSPTSSCAATSMTSFPGMLRSDSAAQPQSPGVVDDAFAMDGPGRGRFAGSLDAHPREPTAAAPRRRCGPRSRRQAYLHEAIGPRRQQRAPRPASHIAAPTWGSEIVAGRCALIVGNPRPSTIPNRTHAIRRRRRTGSGTGGSPCS